MSARFSDRKVGIRELSFPVMQEPTEKQSLQRKNSLVFKLPRCGARLGMRLYTSIASFPGVGRDWDEATHKPAKVVVMICSGNDGSSGDDNGSSDNDGDDNGSSDNDGDDNGSSDNDGDDNGSSDNDGDDNGSSGDDNGSSGILTDIHVVFLFLWMFPFCFTFVVVVVYFSVSCVWL